LRFSPGASSLLGEAQEACAAAASAITSSDPGSAAAAAKLARAAMWARLPPPIAFIRGLIERSLSISTAEKVATILKRLPLSREMKYKVRIRTLAEKERPADASDEAGATGATADSTQMMPIRTGSVSGALLQAQIVTSLLRLGRQREEDAAAVAKVCERLRVSCPSLVQSIADAVEASVLAGA